MTQGSPREMFDVFVMPDVGVDLEVKYPIAMDGAAGRFVVRGPPRKLAILKYVAQGIDDDGEIDGVVSPTKPHRLCANAEKRGLVGMDGIGAHNVTR